MPSAAKIQPQPQGLLSLLELKSGGAYPSLLSDELRGTLELRDWYAATKVEPVANPAIALAVGNTELPSLAIPNLEFWYVHAYTLEVLALAAGESAVVRPGVVYRNVGFFYPTAPYETITGSATSGGRQIGGLFPGGLLLPPNTRFFVNVFDLTGVGTVSGAVQITRMAI